MEQYTKKEAVVKFFNWSYFYGLDRALTVTVKLIFHEWFENVERYVKRVNVSTEDFKQIQNVL